MTKSEIVDRYNTAETTCIYGRMYGSEYITHNFYTGGSKTELDRVIKIGKNEIEEFNAEKGYILFIWGWPGPDYNVYRFDDYGRTWAFDRGELAGEDVEDVIHGENVDICEAKPMPIELLTNCRQLKA